jgi:hypothetical protein
MSRRWNLLAAIPVDRVGIVAATLIVLAAGALAGLAWQTFPRWLPRRSWFRGWSPAALRRWWTRWWARLRGLRWRRKPSEKPEPVPSDVEVPVDALPDVPALDLRSAADRLAAQGRWAEAVRERLRATVRELVDAGVVTRHPEWTVTELARAAAAARPEVAAPLRSAGDVFSGIWYGGRVADRTHDERMREYAGQVHDVLTVPAAGARR